MTTANEMNAFTIKAKEERENKKLNAALKFAINKLTPAMEEIANAGGSNIIIQKPKKIKWKYVKSYLERKNFTVVDLVAYCWIHW